MQRDVVMRLHSAFPRALQSPDLAKRLSDMGVDIVAGSPDELARLMPLEIAKWAAAVKASGAKL